MISNNFISFLSFLATADVGMFLIVLAYICSEYFNKETKNE
jgi:hypothetical protein